MTLGFSEAEILENMQQTALEIISQEKEVEQKLYTHNPSLIEDKVYRSYAVLKNARIISSKEMLQCISYVNMGSSLGLLSGIDMEKLFSLVIDTRPASLIKNEKDLLDEKKRDIKRASIVRNYLK